MVEGLERISGSLKTPARFPERALPAGTFLLCYCLLRLQTHAGLTGEAGGSGTYGGSQASRAERAVSSGEAGLAVAAGRCAAPGWGGEAGSPSPGPVLSPSLLPAPSLPAPLQPAQSRHCPENRCCRVARSAHKGQEKSEHFREY